MYETHYQLNAKPFTLLPDPEFLYLSDYHKTALSLLEYGLASRTSFIVMTGEPGTGKTTLLNRLLSQAGHLWTVGVVSNIHSGLNGLMPWIAAAFGLQTNGKSQVDLFHEFSKFLEDEQIAGRSVLLVLDEAHKVGATMLEELRLLSNLNDGRCRSFQILLSGQPGLHEFLVGPEMVQLAQRVGIEYKLDSLSEDEIGAYISHRLHVAGRQVPLFSPLACRTVFRLSSGVPRLVNQLCDHALIYGYAEQAEWITAHIVLNAAATRAKMGVLPLAISPADIRLSHAELSTEEADLVTFGRKDPQPHPVPSEHPGRDLSQAELSREEADVVTFGRKGPQPHLVPSEHPGRDLSQAELSREAGELTTFGRKDPQPHLVSSKHPGRDLSQAELSTEEADVVTFGMKNPQPYPVPSEHAGGHLIQEPASVYREGLALKEAGEYWKAMSYFDKLAEQDSWTVKALAQKGLCLKAVGRYDDALTVIREAASRRSATDGERDAVQYLLARTLESRGRYPEAREVYMALDRGQRRYRDVSARLARLDNSQADETFTIDIPVSKFSAFWRGCGQLFRGLQG